MIALSSLSTLSSNNFSQWHILFYMISRQIRHHDHECVGSHTRLSPSPKAHIAECLALLSTSVLVSLRVFLSCDARKKALKQEKKALNCVVSIKMSIKRGFSETC